MDRSRRQATSYQGKVFAAGAPLVAVAEGLGRRRASPPSTAHEPVPAPAVDAGDPVAYVQHLKRRPLTYAAPGSAPGPAC